MKTFKYLVNGLEVEAKYDEEDIDKVYKPLLNHWYDLYKQKQCRIVIFIAGCPGSGKSTFVSFLEYLFNQMDFDCKLQTVGMDGFHYYNEELDKMNLRKEKGSPRTFNVEKLKQKIIQTKKEDCYWPYYSRKLHDPIENQIFVHSEIIIIEGNYLLLKDEPWNQLERLCDESLFYNVNVEELQDRLILRKMKGHLSKEEAIDFYNASDKKNVETVINRSKKAAVLFHVFGDANEAIKNTDKSDVDCLLSMELIDFTYAEYLRDSGMLGRNRVALGMGHFNLEEPGMEYMLEYLDEAIGEHIPAWFKQSGDNYEYMTKDCCHDH